MSGARHNPFCAARFAPGALPWFGDASELDAFGAVACRRAARHQILGPHGSGKSSLLAQLARRARASGFGVAELRGSRVTLARCWSALAADIVLLDEAEELGSVRFAIFRGLARVLGVGLIVSAHRDLGLATLTRREVSAELALEIVTHLLSGSAFSAPSSGEIAAHMRRHGGNLREVLFDLYDAVERAAAVG